METRTNRRRMKLAENHKGWKTAYVDWIPVRVVYKPAAPPAVESKQNSGQLLNPGIF